MLLGEVFHGADLTLLAPLHQFGPQFLRIQENVFCLDSSGRVLAWRGLPLISGLFKVFAIFFKLRCVLFRYDL